MKQPPCLCHPLYEEGGGGGYRKPDFWAEKLIAADTGTSAAIQSTALRLVYLKLDLSRIPGVVAYVELV